MWLNEDWLLPRAICAWCTVRKMQTWCNINHRERADEWVRNFLFGWHMEFDSKWGSGETRWHKWEQFSSSRLALYIRRKWSSSSAQCAHISNALLGRREVRVKVKNRSCTAATSAKRDVRRMWIIWFPKNVNLSISIAAHTSHMRLDLTAINTWRSHFVIRTLSRRSLHAMQHCECLHINGMCIAVYAFAHSMSLWS